MIANPTTLILGAGASKPFGYPTGAELRRQIIKRVGMRFQDPVYEELLNRFRWRISNIGTRKFRKIVQYNFLEHPPILRPF